MRLSLAPLRALLSRWRNPPVKLEADMYRRFQEYAVEIGCTIEGDYIVTRDHDQANKLGAWWIKHGTS
jgi:hypothetical protein